MNNQRYQRLLLPALALLAGCSGGGGPISPATPTPNPTPTPVPIISTPPVQVSSATQATQLQSADQSLTVTIPAGALAGVIQQAGSVQVAAQTTTLSSLPAAQQQAVDTASNNGSNLLTMLQVNVTASGSSTTAIKGLHVAQAATPRTSFKLQNRSGNRCQPGSVNVADVSGISTLAPNFTIDNAQPVQNITGDMAIAYQVQQYTFFFTCPPAGSSASPSASASVSPSPSASASVSPSPSPSPTHAPTPAPTPVVTPIPVVSTPVVAPAPVLPDPSLTSLISIGAILSSTDLLDISSPITTNGPTPQLGLAVNQSNGHLYMVNPFSPVVTQITASATSTLAGGSATGLANGSGSAATFNQPMGVAVDSSGNIYIADTGNHAIRKVTSTGVVSTLAGNGSPGTGDGTGTAAQFWFPTGVAVDSSNNVYVADFSNNCIRKIVIATGAVSTFAGSGMAAAGTADGAGTAARFNGPASLTILSDGTLYVADMNNNRIRKITPAGVVSTL